MRGRRTLLAAIWVMPSALLVLVAWLVTQHVQLHAPQPLDGPTRDRILTQLRTALGEAAGEPVPATALAHGGPVVVTGWFDGKQIVRVQGAGATLAAAVTAATEAIAAHPVARMPARERARLRLKVDVVRGRAAVSARTGWVRHLVLDAIADALPVNPGLDGAGTRIDGIDHVLLPDELARERLLIKQAPSDVIPDLATRLDLFRVAETLRRRVKAPVAGWPRDDAAYYRFRVDSFVERAHDLRWIGRAVPLTRGVAPAPPVNAATLRNAALAGGRYLVAHLGGNGRYIYERDLASGSGTDPTRAGPYSIPRHAGVTYFLAELYRHTGAAFLREPIERAFGHLNELIDVGGCRGTTPAGTPWACVIDRGERTATLGSSALAVVALAEYVRATGDRRFWPTTTALAEWILMMQRPDGSFRHRFQVAEQRMDERAQLLYYSGEAALAMARMAELTNDPRYQVAAARALDWLVAQYDAFIAGFFFGEEHWTCIAAEAAKGFAAKPAYRQFCDDYAAFLRREQIGAGSVAGADQADLIGAYGGTPFVLPQNTPAGSRTEAMLSAYALDLHHGQPVAETRNQIVRAVGYLLAQQVRPDNDYHVVTVAGLGGVPPNPLERLVRIDYVQHVCSAMIRASAMLEQE